jgi:hypothetical protein
MGNCIIWDEKLLFGSRDKIGPNSVHGSQPVRIGKRSGGSLFSETWGQPPQKEGRKNAKISLS